MYYKQYGNTDMQVSAIGMGCMRYDEDDVKAGRLDKCAEVALYAADQGINYFDTAPFYCDDKSETITGIALSQLKRDQFYVSSKANLGTTGDVIDEDAFRRRLETTLTRLKVDYLDVYHLWCMLSLESYEKQRDALYGFFEKVRDEGLVRNIAVSSHMPGNELEQVIAEDKFRGMLIGYNALNYRFRQKGIETAWDKGMGVVAMNPLGGGVIPSHPELFTYLADKSGMTVPQAALRFVASHREITVALAGITKPEHVDDAVKSVENLKELPAAELLPLYDNIGTSLNDLCTGCGYCEGCPVDIPIPKFMDAYNQKLFGDSITSRLKNHWDIPQMQAADCIACGECESKCTQHLPIIARLAEIASL
jgi:hypothetical protein